MEILSNLINVPVNTLDIHHLTRIFKVIDWMHFRIAILDIWYFIGLQTWIKWNFELSESERLHLKLYRTCMIWIGLSILCIFEFYTLVVKEMLLFNFFRLLVFLHKKLLWISNELFFIFEKSRLSWIWWLKYSLEVFHWNICSVHEFLIFNFLLMIAFYILLLTKNLLTLNRFDIIKSLNPRLTFVDWIFIWLNNFLFGKIFWQSFKKRILFIYCWNFVLRHFSSKFFFWRIIVFLEISMIWIQSWKNI